MSTIRKSFYDRVKEDMVGVEDFNIPNTELITQEYTKASIAVEEATIDRLSNEIDSLRDDLIKTRDSYVVGMSVLGKDISTESSLGTKDMLYLVNEAITYTGKQLGLNQISIEQYTIKPSCVSNESSVVLAREGLMDMLTKAWEAILATLIKIKDKVIEFLKWLRGILDKKRKPGSVKKESARRKKNLKEWMADLRKRRYEKQAEDAKNMYTVLDASLRRKTNKLLKDSLEALDKDIPPGEFNIRLAAVIVERGLKLEEAGKVNVWSPNSNFQLNPPEEAIETTYVESTELAGFLQWVCNHNPVVDKLTLTTILNDFSNVNIWLHTLVNDWYSSLLYKNNNGDFEAEDDPKKLTNIPKPTLVSLMYRKLASEDLISKVISYAKAKGVSLDVNGNGELVTLIPIAIDWKKEEIVYLAYSVYYAKIDGLDSPLPLPHFNIIPYSYSAIVLPTESSFKITNSDLNDTNDTIVSFIEDIERSIKGIIAASEIVMLAHSNKIETLIKELIGKVKTPTNKEDINYKIMDNIIKVYSANQNILTSIIHSHTSSITYFSTTLLDTYKDYLMQKKILIDTINTTDEIKD